jgi:hypothetical protein
MHAAQSATVRAIATGRKIFANSVKDGARYRSMTEPPKPTRSTTRRTLKHFHSLDGELVKGGHSYECYQYFLRSAHRAVHDPAAPLDAQIETTDRGVRNTKDVSVLRIDHIPTKGQLLGVWQAPNRGGVLDFKEMNRRFGTSVPQNLFREGH